MRHLKRLGAAATLFSTSLYVHAESLLPANIDQQFTDVKADMVKVFGLLFVLVLAIVGWRYLKRAAS
jgi:hypothetical protein